MTTPGFAPGPWTVEEGIIVDADGCFVAQVLSTYIEGANYRDAHAHLIAAAPVMYEALQKIVELCDDGDADIMARQAAKVAKRALSQAEGGGGKGAVKA